MIIDEGNIEDLILASIEGILPPVDETQLKHYISTSPEATKLYEEYKKTILNDREPVVFPYKEELYRSLVNKDNIEHYIVSKVENILSASETEAVDSYISRHAEAVKLLADYQRTVLVAEKLEYPFKNDLYKTAKDRRSLFISINYMALTRVAAILILSLSALATWKWLLPSRPETHGGVIGSISSNNNVTTLNSPVAKVDLQKHLQRQPIINEGGRTVNANAGVAIALSNPKINNNFDEQTRALLAAGKAYKKSTLDGFAIDNAAAIEQPSACQTFDCLKQAGGGSLVADNSYNARPDINIRPYRRQNNSPVSATYTENDDNSTSKARTFDLIIKKLTGQDVGDSVAAGGKIKAIHLSYNGEHFKFSKTIRLK